MRYLGSLGAALLAAVLLAHTPALAGGWGPTVYTTPDDVTPFRRSDDVRPFRDRPDRFERPAGRVIEREIQRELNRVQRPARALEGPNLLEQQRRRDLAITEQDLRALQTRAPRTRALPLLELQLDRVERQLDEVERQLDGLRGPAASWE